MELNELRDKRGRLIHEANTILEAVARDKRETMTAEEEQRFDALHNEADSYKRMIERAERQADEMAALDKPTGRKTDPARPERKEYASTDEQRDHALRAWFLHRSNISIPNEWRDSASRLGFDPGVPTITFGLSKYPLKSRRDLEQWEKRAQSLTGSAGGFTVPDSAMQALEISLLEFGGMRQAANVIRTDSGSDLPIPTSNDTSNKGVILAENTAVAEQDITFAQVVLSSFKYSSKLIRISVELLQDSAFDLSGYIGDQLGIRIGRIQNDHFTTGTGTGEPNGIITAAAVGKTGASATSVTYGELVDLVHSVDPAYRAQGARWMFNDNTLSVIKKLTDTQNRPLWVAGMTEREPDRLLGYPYIINQSMASMASNAKSIVFGALQKYWIRDVRSVELVRLNERYAEFHQVAFLGLARSDGDLIDAGTDPVKLFQNAA